MKDKNIVMLLGTHGSGKTYNAIKYYNIPNSVVVNTDFVDSGYYHLIENSSADIRQTFYSQYNLIKTLEGMKLLEKDNINNVVFDFGLTQILPYSKLFGVEDIYLFHKEQSDKILSDIKDKYDLYVVLFSPPRDIIKERIIKRNRPNLEWELETYEFIDDELKKEVDELDRRGYNVIVNTSY